jgi:O-antigen/teichoic acid export membrane protein
MGKHGDSLVADYRIIQNVTMIVTLIAGVFLQNFIPYITKTSYRGDQNAVKEFVFNSTKWLSIYISFVCALIIFNSKSILILYVGDNGSGLHVWLSIWMLGVLFQNNQGISSVILAAGKFKQLTIGLIFASACSITFSLLFIEQLGLGVVPIAFLMYKTIEALSIFGYYVPHLVKIGFLELFRFSIFKPLVFSLFTVSLCTSVVNLVNISPLISLLSTGAISFVLYSYLIFRHALSDNEFVFFNNLWLNKGRLFGTKRK